jgi:hypothetical protein
MARLVPVGALAFLLVLAGAAGASASVRYASPGGEGGSPCNPTPCSLVTAVLGAEDGDRVVLADGAYETAANLILSKAIEVGGAPGAFPTVVFSGAHSAVVVNGAADLHDVRVALAEETMAYALDQRGGTVERVLADGSNGAACSIMGGTLRDTACSGFTAVAAGEPGKFSATLRNVTAAPLLIGAFGGASLSATVVNTIAQPGYSAGSSPSGLVIDVGPGSSATVALANSNYNSVDTSPSAGTEFSFTPPGTNGNQTAEPRFFDGPAGDFRELATSPTVDAGLAEPLLGPLDVAGAPRSQPACIGGNPVPDIGAYEFTPSVPCSAGGSPLPPGNFRVGRLRRHPRKGTATLPVAVPGPGALALFGKGLVRRRVAVGRAKTVRLLVKAKGSRARALRHRGRLKVRAHIVFRPEGGAPRWKQRTLRLRLRLRPRSRNPS